LPTGGTYTINGTTYSSTDVGSLQGDMSFNKVAPYIGIGWGNPAARDKGWGMTSDIGVLFQGTPKTSLVATCGAAIAGTATCTQLQSDTAAENTKLQNDLRNFKWWPVVSVGISYQW
jgi:glycerate kinase